MADNKTKPTDQTVDSFISGIEDDKKRADSQALINLMREATGEEPKMWGPSIIGFGSYHYKYESGREGDNMKVGFSPRKEALTLYGLDITAAEGQALLGKLGKCTTGKSCVYIKKLSDVDTTVLKELIQKSAANNA